MHELLNKHKMTIIYVIVLINIILIAVNVVPLFLIGLSPQSFYPKLICDIITSEEFRDNAFIMLLFWNLSELVAIILLLITSNRSLVLDYITAWIYYIKLALCVILSPLFLVIFWLPQFVEYIKKPKKR